MKLLKTGTLALSLTVTATVGLAADYEIFADFATVETGANHYAAERLDHKNKKLHHCTAVLDAETKQLSGAMHREARLSAEIPPVKDRTVQGGMSNRFGGLPVFGSWKIDQATGKTEFCISDICSVRGGNSAILKIQLRTERESSTNTLGLQAYRWIGNQGPYCSSTILPLAYSKRFSRDRNDRPSRFSDNASSGSTMASTSRTIEAADFDHRDAAYARP